MSRLTTWPFLGWAGTLCLLAVPASSPAAQPPILQPAILQPAILQPAILQPAVEVEEEVYAFQNANNGAGPMWCGGSTCLVRGPFGVIASGLETIPKLKPLNNCRWMLFHRTNTGWDRLHADPEGRTREPCPLATFHDGQVFLSTNPTLTEPNVHSGAARPEVLQIELNGGEMHSATSRPQWQANPAFSEHSYRSFSADGKSGELVLFQNVGYGHAEWSFRDASDNWSAAGQLKWPWGAEYDKPQPIRICYPNVMLKNRAVHFCGVSDIIEPYMKWRAYKKQLTGRDWDYDFRRLFYTWCDDITTGKFHAWVEIASRDKTCGWVRPSDLWVDDHNRVHILWTERALDERLRDKFFPELKQSNALNYAMLVDGQMRLRRSLVLAEEGGQREMVGFARFHVSESGRLFVFYYVHGAAEDGKQLSENRMMEIFSDGSTGEQVTVLLEKPFVNFFTANVRAGSPRSDVIDLLGQQAGHQNTIAYARIRLR